MLANEDCTGLQPRRGAVQRRCAATSRPTWNAVKCHGLQRGRLGRRQAGHPAASACSDITRRSSGASATTGSTRTKRTSLIDTGPDWYGELPYIGVAERQQYLTLAVRDYLNGGGKLRQRGEWAQDYGILGFLDGGLFYGLNGNPTAECVVTTGDTGHVRRTA